MEQENNGQAQVRNNERMRGTQVKTTLSLTNPEMIRAFNKVFKGTENNLFYMLRIAPGSLREDYPKNTSERITQQLDEKFDSLKRLQEHVERMLTAADAEMGESAGSEKIEVSFRTPAGKRYVDLWKACDATLMLVDTAWLHGLITDEKRGEYVSSVVKQVNKFWTQTSSEFRSFQRKVQERRNKAGGAENHPEGQESASDSEESEPASNVLKASEHGLKAA